MILISFVQCKKESDDCHFFITINNNSNQTVLFARYQGLLDTAMCGIGSHPTEDVISSLGSIKYRPYPHPDCIESVLKLDRITEPLLIVDPNNYNPSIVPCEELEERNTILRTYILTLEDLERMNYTINYPEDASIGVE